MIFNKWKMLSTLSVLIIALLLFSNAVSYAQTFTDVKDDYWAADYIKKVKSLGIITGYPDATFRPASEVTKVQALVMISRLYKLDNNIITDIKNKYQGLLDELKVELWAQDGIAVALSSGIISEEVLKEYYKSEKAKMPATKEEICIFLTRAMGLEKEAKSKTIIILPFKDAELIPAQVAPYVDMMIQKGIINEKGDSQGRFNPKSSMNRAMMAKVLSIAYDYIKENKVAQQIFSDIGIEDKDTITISGTIVSILKDANEAYITIEDMDGQKNIYFVDANTDITLDDSIIKFTDLVEGLMVEVKVTEKQRIVSMKAKSIEEKYSGKVKSLILTTPAILTIEYEENGNYKVKSFYLDSNAKIILDDEETFVYKINEGDLVQLKIKNNKITEIIAESKGKHIKGIIKEIKYNPEPNLTVEDENGNLYEFPIDNKVKIERNSKNAVITDLRNGDKVEIDVEYNVIIEIKAEALKDEDEGIIKAILISSKPKLTILNKDGEEVSYYISKNVDIKIDGKKDSIYGLRLGYFAEIDIESNEIVSMKIEPREQNDRYEGTIEYLNYDAGVIVLSVNNYKTGEKEIVRIDIVADTSFIDSDGDKIKFKYLNVGDELIVIGNFDGGIFTAKTIIVTQRSK
ncbi:S-layer homology domain-containing protein [Caloranaerobacter ferrireducens]|uniref:S-layer homology domain-containing protein n=1 Tax=Caloranaerobacter ferrireducens TaxID=1323370 RepID=UPI00084D40B9|nr:S-layer homology domain-containing protein [Caloranaerobacter ferrireducens]